MIKSAMPINWHLIQHVIYVKFHQN